MSKTKFNENEKESFRRFADTHAPKSRHLANGVRAFCTGGLICVLGQGINDLYLYIGAEKETAAVLTPVTLIFLSCLFTGFGLYGRLAKKAGGGTLVPITGFANAVCAPAVDAKPEGYILGVGAKMFTIAGPVILYGSAASVVWGIVYYFLHYGKNLFILQ